MKTARYGWIPDLPDHRDHLYAVAVRLPLPLKIDLRPECPDVIYDQGQLGSCTANAIAFALQFDLKKQKSIVFMPSRLFIYYNEREIENTIESDSGAMLRHGIKSVAKCGACNEILWPYDDSNPGPFSDRPAPTLYTEALKHRATTYQSVPRSLLTMRTCLASGYPFVLGFSVYEGFESDAVAQTGLLELPGPSESLLGGHAVVAVGYDDVEQRFLIRNSWGPNWGIGGYFTMPYDYLTNPDLSADFWTIRAVSP